MSDATRITELEAKVASLESQLAAGSVRSTVTPSDSSKPLPGLCMNAKE